MRRYRRGLKLFLQAHQDFRGEHVRRAVRLLCWQNFEKYLAPSRNRYLDVADLE